MPSNKSGSLNGGVIGVANDPITELVTTFTSNGTFTSR